MTFLAISCGALIFMLLVLLFRPIGQNADQKKRRLSDAIQKETIEKYEEMEQSFYDRFFRPILRGTIHRISFLIPKSRQQDSAQLQKALHYAGISLSVSEFNASKAVFLLCTVALSVLLAFLLSQELLIRLLILLIGILIGTMGPLLLLRSKTQKRRTEIQHQLPDVMDILMVSVEAGLGLDEAIARMSTKMSGTVIEEFQMVLRETQMGKPRREAFLRLADCADIQELKVFVSAVVQAEQLGIPIKNVLSAQATSMRDMRRQIAQEKGMKAPVKMILPMVMFILPVLLIILLGPVAIQLIQEFS